MSQLSSTNPAPALPRWQTFAAQLTLWHGTLQSYASDIQATGVDLARSRNSLDFGRGFYTTTNQNQAEQWARRLHLNLAPADRRTDRPALIRFELGRAEVATLDSLAFVRSDAANGEFWAFVHHCRGSTTSPRTHLHPGRHAPDDWYDLVSGPVALVWPPKGTTAIPDFDQFSFHTSAALAILNAAIQTGPPSCDLIVL